jgi:hypothetical protein
VCGRKATILSFFLFRPLNMIIYCFILCFSFRSALKTVPCVGFSLPEVTLQNISAHVPEVKPAMPASSLRRTARELACVLFLLKKKEKKEEGQKGI